MDISLQRHSGIRIAGNILSAGIRDVGIAHPNAKSQRFCGTMATRSRGGWTAGSSFSPPPHQLLFVLLIVLLFVFLSWYMAYESAWESTMEQLKTWIMVSPLLLLLAVRWLASTGSRPIISLPRSHPNAIHRAGSSPWGVALLLILLLVMISYQSVFHDQWFPLFRSRD